MKLKLYSLWWPNHKELEQIVIQNGIRQITSKHGDFFYWLENQTFWLNFFNWSALNSIKKVEENQSEETQ